MTWISLGRKLEFKRGERRPTQGATLHLRDVTGEDEELIFLPRLSCNPFDHAETGAANTTGESERAGGLGEFWGGKTNA